MKKVHAPWESLFAEVDSPIISYEIILRGDESKNQVHYEVTLSALRSGDLIVGVAECCEGGYCERELDDLAPDFARAVELALDSAPQLRDYNRLFYLYYNYPETPTWNYKYLGECDQCGDSSELYDELYCANLWTYQGRLNAVLEARSAGGCFGGGSPVAFRYPDSHDDTEIQERLEEICSQPEFDLLFIDPVEVAELTRAMVRRIVGEHSCTEEVMVESLSKATGCPVDDIGRIYALEKPYGPVVGDFFVEDDMTDDYDEIPVSRPLELP